MVGILPPYGVWIMNRLLKAKIIECFGSQFEFSIKAGLHESFVSKVVRNRRTLSHQDQEKWAMLLNCRPNEIFED